MISIDGAEWGIPCSVERVSEMTPSEISGLMLDKSYFNDVLGTYLRYEITLAVPPSMSDDYSELYEALTEPVDGHTFVFPYNQGDVEITARVENVQDVLVYTASEKQYWKGVKFAAVSNYPTKTMGLSGVITRGRSPMPEALTMPVGASFVMTASGWSELQDASEVYY